MSSCVKPPAHSPIRYAIFDLDGVITDTAKFHYLAWKRLADEIGVPFDEDVNERLRGVDRLASLRIVLERSPRTYSAEEQQALAERKNGYYREMIQTITPADLLPGIPELLQALRERGIPMALASASKNAPDVITRLRIAGWFSAVVDAAQITRGKPDPEIFLAAAKLLDAPPQQCVVVEDAQAGIDAAKRAGMRAVAVNWRGRLEGADASSQGTQGLTVDMLLGT